MRRHCLTLFTLILLFTNSALAKDESFLLSYQQLINLTTPARAAYLNAIRKALVDIEIEQGKKKTAELKWHFSLFDEAHASSSSQCIIAGWIGSVQKQSDGLLHCVPPAEASRNCADKEHAIECGPALYSDFCVKIDAYTGSSCDTYSAPASEVARNYLSNPNLRTHWQQFTESVASICASGIQSEASCNIIKNRLAIIERTAQLPAAHLSAETPKPNIYEVHDQRTSQVHQNVPCKTDRDQGHIKACHSFCVLCTLDRLAASQGFRTSANWVLMLSAVDRVCDSTENITSAQQLYNKSLSTGYDPEYNYKLAMKYGYCSEDEYLPFSDKEPGPMSPSHNLARPKTSDPFFNQFGITLQDMRSLYCPPGTNFDPSHTDSGYADRLAKISRSANPSESPAFLRCANQSQQIANRIKADQGACTPHTRDYQAHQQSKAADDIQTAIALGFPVSIGLAKNDGSAKPSVEHCVTAYAFDRSKGEVDIINSHGATASNSSMFYSSQPIKIGADPLNRKILGLFYLDCPRTSGQRQRPAPSNGQKSAQ